jgi:hypothetical protein
LKPVLQKAESASRFFAVQWSRFWNDRPFLPGNKFLSGQQMPVGTRAEWFLPARDLPVQASRKLVNAIARPGGTPIA